MKEKKRANIIKVGKIALGSALSIMIADLLHLSFGTAAGIITLLTVQNTKKETLLVAGRRIIAFLLAMITSFFVFSTIGYSAGSFGVFLFLFVIICEQLELQDGLSICAVLVTHFLSLGYMTIEAVQNEFLLLIIGISVGALINLYIPRNIGLIRQSQVYIEGRLKEILKHLAAELKNEPSAEYVISVQELHLYIQNAVSLAYENRDNTFLADSQYFIGYMELRLNQLIVIERIFYLIHRVEGNLPQSKEVADFMIEIAESLQESNNGVTLLEKYERLLLFFEGEKLPVGRKEFEDRATLYQILHELKWFLSLKCEFAEKLTKKQKEEFWNIIE